MQRRRNAWVQWGLRGVIAALVWGPVFWAGAARAEPWTVVAEEEGVTVEQRSLPGREVPMFRGRKRMQLPLESVLPVLLDTTRFVDWMPECVEARTLGERGRTAYYTYNRTGLPWPISDRDVVLEGRIVMVEPGREVHALFESVELEAAPPVSGVVRMPLLRGHYKLRAAEGGATDVELQMEMDPGGSLPRWLIPRIAKDNPIRTLVALQEQAEATREDSGPFYEDWLEQGHYEVPAEAAEETPAGMR